MNQNVLFESGIKPAILIRHLQLSRCTEGVSVETNEFKKYKDKYPYLLREEGNGVLFFQDEDALKWFKDNGLYYGYSKMNGKEISDFKQDILGEVLGYPPLATQKWESMGIENRYERVEINYYGMSFICFATDADDCIAWLRENRPVPSHVAGDSKITVRNVVTREIKESM